MINEFRKGLSGRGSPVWVRLHLHIHPWAPSACTQRSHSLKPLITLPPNTHTQSHTHFNMWKCSSRAVYRLMSFPWRRKAAAWVREAEGEGQRQGEPSESGTLARRARHSLRLGVPLWASVRLFLTAAITANNWTANEDKWYDCGARPSSQSTI